MEIRLPDGTRRSEDGPIRIDALIMALGMSPFEVIVSVNGEIIPENALVSGDAEVRIIRVAHGG